MRSGANSRLARGRGPAGRTARRPAHLLQHPVGVELHHLPLDPLAGGAEALQRALVLELDADLRDQPLPAPLERVEAVGERISRGARRRSNTLKSLGVHRVETFEHGPGLVMTRAGHVRTSSGFVPSSFARSSAMRCTATVSGKTESSSGSPRSAMVHDIDPEAASRTGDLEHALGARAAAVQHDETVAGAKRKLSGSVQQLLGREALGGDVGRLPRLERPLGCRPRVRPRAGELEQPGRRGHRGRRASSARATASGTRWSSGRSAPSARASWASRSRAPRWLAVKAELRSGSTVSMSPPAPMPEDDDGADLVAAGRVARLCRVALAVSVREQDQRVARGWSRSSERRGEGLDRPGLAPRGAQQVGAVVGRVEARSGAGEQDPLRAADAI